MHASTPAGDRKRPKYFSAAWLPFCLPVFLVSGCVHARAKTITEMPPLEVPAPPPRVVETTGVEAPPPMGLIQEPARNLPPGAARPTTPVPRPAAAQPEAPKAETAAPAEAPKAADDVARPQSPTLQTTPAQQEVEVESKIRVVLSRASSVLNHIDYTRLNANAKSQYDSAKRFVSLAEEALHSKNLVYAGTLAEKADALAAQLPLR